MLILNTNVPKSLFSKVTRRYTFAVLNHLRLKNNKITKGTF